MSGKRLALRFARGPEAAGLGHREAIAVWESALAASELPLASVEGRGGRPRFTVVAPLPPGYTSDAELLEILLSRPVAMETVSDALNAALPSGIRVIEGRTIAKGSPTLQSQVRWAEYAFDFGPEVDAQQVQAACDVLFSRSEFPWQETVEGKTKQFDLLYLVDDLWLGETDAAVRLNARLDASGNGTGRPDALLAGLGLPEPRSKARTALILWRLPQATAMWRRAGRFENPRPER
jgi:radical SAM-linked protein